MRFFIGAIVALTAAFVLGIGGGADAAGGAPDGAAKFKAVCEMCHGKAGVGTAMGPALAKNAFIKSSKPEDIVNVILVGRAGKDKKYPKITVAMPPHKGKLKDDEVMAIVKYLKTLQ